MTLSRTMLALVLGSGLCLVACGDDDSDDGSTTDGGATGEGDCSDPEVNVFAGTCVETFLADCFDPVGECDGTIDMTTGSTTMTWSNGASVESEVDTSNPTSPAVTTYITSSDGTVCAIGDTQMGAAGCASLTVYERQSDGATQSWCIQQDSSMEVSCSDGGTVSVTAAQSQAASSCGFASGAEPCEFDY